MAFTVEAVYENGVLKPVEPLPLQEHERVRVTVQSGRTRADATSGLMGWTGSNEVAEYFATDPELAFPLPSEE